MDIITSLSTLQITIATTTLIIIILTLRTIIKKPKPIYLIDFSCYKPPDNLRVPASHFLEQSLHAAELDQDGRDFQEKLLVRSGISSQACMPVGIHRIPIQPSLSDTVEEISDVLFTITDDLLKKTNTNPSSIDVLVTNCSIACPTPSISAMIVRRFGLRPNVRSFSLGGMGCSAGILAVSLAKDILRSIEDGAAQGRNGSMALVLSMESISPSGYEGSVKSMLIGNVLFRMGGAAVLLSNRSDDLERAKYELSHLVRTHMGSDNEAYESVYQREDTKGKKGVSITRSLLKVASKALMANVSELGPKVLPYSEQFRYAISIVSRLSFFKRKKDKTSSSPEIYVPDFKKAFEHFCIHAGGRAVIDGLETSLGLRPEDTEASKMTLYRFGNTSSSSVWYELCYLEAKIKVKRGDRVWQIAFGSGFKCNSAVWKRINDRRGEEVNAWSDRIDLFPVDTQHAGSD